MLKVGQNVTVLQILEDGYIAGDDSGKKYYIPILGVKTDKFTELSGVIRDMGYDPEDPYNARIIKIIDRLLADDYTGSGLFEDIDAALDKAERRDTEIQEA